MRFRRALWVLVTCAVLLPLAATGFAHEDSTPAPDLRPHRGPVGEPQRDTFFSEGFEDTWPPAGWEIIQLGSSNTWASTTNASHGGVNSAWVHYGPQGDYQDEYLVTSAIDLSTVGAAYLEFYEDQSYWLGYGDHHYIGVSTTSQTDPGAFTMIVDWTPANHTIDEGFAGDPVTVSLQDYVGESVVYLCFRYTGDYADDWYIDDIRVYEPYQHDVAVMGVVPDDIQLTGGVPVTPQISVENMGSNPEDIDLELRISESGSQVYFESLPVHLEIGESVLVDFLDFLPAAGNYYHFQAASVLATDEDTSNDGGQSFCHSYTRTHVPLGWIHTNAG